MPHVWNCNAQAGCREAVLAYLWALVGVNEGRAIGGEKGVLKEQAISEGLCLSNACSVAFWRMASAQAGMQVSVFIRLQPDEECAL